MSRPTVCDVLFPGAVKPHGLTVNQVEQLFQVPLADVSQCWLTAIMEFVRTGNLYAAAVAFLECLIENLELTRDELYKLESALILIKRAEATGTDEFVVCVFNLLVALFTGVPLDKALVDFVVCMFGSVAPPTPPPPGPSPGSPNYRRVNRCG